MTESQLPRVVIAGLSGSAGKTLVALGVARALLRQGRRVAVFKKGPDFIDSIWLGMAARTEAYNLDTFLAKPSESVKSLQRSAGADIAIIEGNRGLFDGFDAQGTHSTAELAKLIETPVILVIDATKATRTIAALVLGCQALDPALTLAGVILNRVGTPRQELVIRDALAMVTQVPVLGAIPRLATDHLPSRHLGLVLPVERHNCEQLLDALGSTVAEHVDLVSLQRVAAQASPLPVPETQCGNNFVCTPNEATVVVSRRVRIGVLKDAAFSFYYTENLQALKAAGATLIPISPLADARLPSIDGLYAGGGYPEHFARQLSANARLRGALLQRISAGMPVWAECGGLMYLAAALERNGVIFPMVGALPIITAHMQQPQAHGYVQARIDTANPYFAVGTCLRGHEFHHSCVVTQIAPVDTALSLERGVGVIDGRDGIIRGRIFASYLHLFAPGVPDWAESFARVVRQAAAETSTRELGGEYNGKHLCWRNQHRNRRRWVHSGT